jgi:imidazolonepropionase-like amidohydrolase
MTACLILLATWCTGADPSETLVFRGATIWPASGAPIENGILVVQDGKIIAIGAADQVTVPPDARVLDMSGKTIIPGLVDTHSHIGIYPRPAVPANQDGNEATGPVTPGIRAMDAIDPDDPGIRMALSGGVTTANIMPGSSNVIGGQTIYVKLRGRTIEEMKIPTTKVVGGLKMANGENPKGYGRRQLAPATRMKVAALQREQFIKAREYQKKWQAYQKARDAGEKPKSVPERDLALEPLVEVLERKRTVHFHSHRADDLMTAARIAEEFGFELVLHHVTEGYRVADHLAQHHIPCSLTLVDSPGGKLEAAAIIEESAGILHKAGIKLAINTDDFITDSRIFLRTASAAIRGGIPDEEVLKAVTLNPAEMLHLEDRIGSLEKGKDADFVILTGPPFSTYTHVLETYIDGKRVFDRANPHDRAYQTGGFALTDPARLPPSPKDATPLDPAAVPAAAGGAGVPPSKPNRLAISAGRLHTATHGTIVDGVIVIENGKIQAIGRRSDVTIPEGARLLTAADVTPGFIDANTVVGLSGMLNTPADQDQDETTDPNQADCRALDGFNPNEPHVQFIRQQGVTIVQACPGRANVIAGQAGIFRTAGRTVEQMTLRFPSAIVMNLGEIPKATYPNKYPNTRMGVAGLIRTALMQTQENARKKDSAKEEDKRPARNPKIEALEPALKGEIPVLFAAHRANDIETALRIAREYHLKPVLTLATEGYLVADSIAAAKVPVVAHPTMQRIGSLETYNTYLGNAAALAARGIPVSIGTAYEGYVPKQRVLRYEAAMAAVNGLGFEGALKAITIDAARLLGLEDRYGSLDSGKQADIVLFDGDPFENRTHVLYTIMDGRVVYDRGEYLKIPFERRALPLVGSDFGCCMGLW